MRNMVGHKHEAGSVEVVLVDGMPVASPLDSWRQLSTLLSLDELIAAGDSLLRREAPLLARHQLVVALARHGGHRGAKKLREAWEQVRSGCDSARETRLRLVLVRAGLPEPRVNAVVSRPGRPLRFGDLVYEQWRVIVEYDGRHHLTAAQRAADILRLEQLAREGWTTVVVLAEHLATPSTVVTRVAQALRANGWPG
jgi:hypothetical protein